jgi:hypothetical protein
MDGQPKPSLETHERELKNTRQEVRNLQVLQMRPGQSAEKLRLLADLERSARAEVKLRVKALAYARSQVDKPSRSKPTEGAARRTLRNLFRKPLKNEGSKTQ